ncbi:single-stranded-DNA-specific exonuclease RecJ [Enterococcus montenegrensis]|nr:single-stranded-DNA-specific exonuclease RecJ [Enterococcus montenegrensis]WHA10411.1 single-stranded-DNA-specific exonuclease RecJ [Enterococcus montenegrensis]
MSSSMYNWQLPENKEVPKEFVQICEKYNLNTTLAKLLWQREIKTENQLTAFLQPQIDQLHDPFALFEMDKVVERIQTAIMNGERILVYGDYDADGITSTTIMTEALELLGADVSFYLPNRFKDGYGPNLEVYQEKIAAGIQLIITVDNGVSGHEAINYANGQGVDVIVTDHHELPKELPAAFGIIHPRHPAGSYPFGELAGVGVAFKVACALLEEVPAEFLDLVAIGTVADMVSLTDENRVLVTYGLKALQQTQRLGLQALLKISGVEESKLDEQSIGFALAPRLNAIGRLSDPNEAVDLLKTFDEQKAISLAKDLDEINQKRKSLVEEITKEALALINSQDAIHIVAQSGWHEGVLGIVAGRILKETGKPAIVLTIKEDGIAKGSGRSIASLNMFAMLDEMRELFTSFGGHHAAVGVSVPVAALDQFKENVAAYAAGHKEQLVGNTLAIDGILNIADATIPLIKELKQLAPFGMDNPQPYFMLQHIFARDLKTIGADNNHLKFNATDGENTQLTTIGFGFGNQLTSIENNELSIVGQLQLNEWNGRQSPQLQLIDFAAVGLQLVDLRAKKKRQNLQFDANTLFVCFGNKVPTDIKTQILTQVHHFKDLTHLKLVVQEENYSSIAFLDCPMDALVLKEILSLTDFHQLYLVLNADDDAYLDGLGTREQYGRLFKLIAQQDTLDVRYKLPSIAQFLKIPEKLLIFMIQVFFDLEFVTISDGLLHKTEVDGKKDLTTSVVYKRRQQKIKTEEFLLLSDMATLKTWFEN